MSCQPDRRRFLERCGLLTVGAAGGVLLPRWFEQTPPAIAQEKKPEHSAEEQLKKLKLELPPIAKPTGATLVSAVRVGDMLYCSGQGPGSVDGKPVVGKVGQDFDVKQGAVAARQVGLRILSVVRGELGSLDKVIRLVKTLGMVNATADFKQQPQVINGFSDLMVEVFGEQAGKGARSAVGMGSLPGGIPVEIEAIFQVRA
ncbi:MAG: RidA family protein [Gemmataceae bacterium]|nr:RidA family protein [Gemmataceae bacterium]